MQCAGRNDNSQLGVAPQFTTPQASALTSGTTAIAAGAAFTCAIVGGGVQCWGTNASGELGNGTTTPSTTPVQVSGLTSGVSALASSAHTCALLSTGSVKCWGRNDRGQLGNGTTTNSLVPVQVSGLTSGVTAISAGSLHTCALLSTGAVKCWGFSQNGQIGNGNIGSVFTTPTQVSGLTSGVTAIVASANDSCALLSTGAAQCWGSNGYGTLGIGTTTDSATPVQVTGLTSGVTALAGVGYSICALRSTGAVQCWGYNAYGQLGNGTTTAGLTPVQVYGLTSGVTALTTGGMSNNQACALLSGGAVKCWGYNQDGELGNGTTTNSTVPVQVSGLTSGVVAVTAGNNHVCARLSTNAISCWGDNGSGQLGMGASNTQAVPVFASNGFYNGGLISSQASVLVQKFAEASGSTISGHVMPIVYTMANATTGSQALMVTYDPLATAAAMFIEQYDKHIAACKATTSESITETQQQAGTYLWACSNANAKSAYLSGMQTLLTGARTYLFGQTDGCIRNSTVGGVACGTADKINVSYAHFPYTFFVPGYTSSTYNGDPTVTTDTGAYYYTPLSTALQTYRNGVAASTASTLHRTLQLAGIATFGPDATTGADSAIITTRVQRSGAFGTGCVSQ